MSLSTDQVNDMVSQIGRMNLFAISGGRVQRGPDNSISLPISNGYSVEIELDLGADLYNVRRVFRRGTKIWIKGEREGVYCDELSEVAYYASCFRSYDETEWMSKA